MKRHFFLVLTFTISMLNSTAQVILPRQCEVSRPRLIDQEMIYESDIKKLEESEDWGQSMPTNVYWIVYSDRSGNTLYNNPSVQADSIGTLTFNEEVRIAQIKNDFALVYVEMTPGISYPKIHTAGKRGWIPMKNLLLWNSCPVNDMGIDHKALPVLEPNGTTYRVYDNPETKSDSRRLVSDSGFFFIMKEDEATGMILLSLCNILHSGALSQNLFGWVTKSSIYRLEHRICIMPNFKKEDINSQNIPTNLEHRIGSIPFPLIETNLDANSYKILCASSSLENQSDVSDNNSQHSVFGFIAYNVPIDNNWKPVIYISKAEYNELMGRLQPVMAAAEEGSQSRIPYVEAMKALTMTLYGGDISESKIMSMDIKQIMALVAGLPVKSDALGGRTLMQIEDYNVVSEDEFNNLISVFQDRYRKLDRIKNGYKCSVNLQGDTWYWIPVEDLP